MEIGRSNSCSKGGGSSATKGIGKDNAGNGRGTHDAGIKSFDIFLLKGRGPGQESVAGYLVRTFSGT